MKTLSRSQAIEEINQLADKRTPFLFIADFKAEKNHVLKTDEIHSDELLFSINGNNNTSNTPSKEKIRLDKESIPFSAYETYFSKVHEQLSLGNTYLLNLTFPSKISTDHSLKDIFDSSHARYKLLFNDQFVVFSPEIFVQIENGLISSFPMKGTIDADIENAEEKILTSEKEMAEHTTIVDLIRNDMSKYASKVTVENFRYVDEVKTSHKHLLQVSSKIVGQLADGFESKLGEIIYSLLPAGSISGAPKKKTLELIDEIEDYDRGYYTGVFGYYDGKNLDSGVMIRYIEKDGTNLYYKSGGGIHYLSDAANEYQEMIDKVYVPIR